MRVLVIGNGGREHAIVRALSKDPEVGELHAAPGNPGIGELAARHAVSPADPRDVTRLARRVGAGLVVIGPEAPLVAGVADELREHGIATFGPGAAAARIEGSKAFAKEVMARAGIPTARARTATTPAEADAALAEFGPPYVVKDDALAAGKGVVVTTDLARAREHAASCAKVVIEEYLDGPEVSLFALADGTTAVPLLPAQDFKRAYDGDEGPNTGGMGAYTPLPWAPAGLSGQVMDTVIQPAIDALRGMSAPYAGLLYAGLALTSKGVRVVEFNARFGDPEAQVVLDRLATPPAGLLHAAATGDLARLPGLAWHPGAAVTVVIAAEGYPAAPATGDKIAIDHPRRTDAYVLHAGTSVRPAVGDGGQLVSAGGRVLNAVGSGPDLAIARAAAYEVAAKVTMRGGWYRGDIAERAAQLPLFASRLGRAGHMIDRYTLPEMGRVWSEAHKYELWCRVEVLVLEAHAKAGTVPAEAVAPVRAAAPPTPEAVAAVEAVTDHDVIAFLTAWADNTEPRSAAAYVHFGMTSSDLLDTALAVHLAEASDILLAKAGRLVAVLRDHALAHRDTLRPGRTHGIHAEPDVWGHRVADFAFAAARSRDRIRRAREAVAVGTLSGPVGTYSNIDPGIEAEVMPALGLRPADVATQVVIRDGIAEWVSALAVLATVCEAIALEVRHGQRTEVRELAEPFRSGQKGSSAMPHKKNPIRSERICGLARVVRSYVTPVTEGIPLWHERDISHSSVERIALPDAAIATDYLLHLTTGLIEGLVVDTARMRANLDVTGGLLYSSAVLLELVKGGMSREDAYTLVQAAAMDTWDTGTPFRDSLLTQGKYRNMTIDESALDRAFRPDDYVARLTPVFDRLAQLT